MARIQQGLLTLGDLRFGTQQVESRGNTRLDLGTRDTQPLLRVFECFFCHAHERRGTRHILISVRHLQDKLIAGTLIIQPSEFVAE
jgi:hypothetical protein